MWILPEGRSTFDVSNNRRDGPPFASRRLSAPRFRRQILNHVLIDPVIGVESGQ